MKPVCSAAFSTPSTECIITTMMMQMPLRSEEHTSELQSQSNLVCRLLLEKKNVVSRISGSAGVRLRPAAPVVLCDFVDVSLSPGLYLPPLVDSKQSRPVGRSACRRLDRLFSARRSDGVAAAGRVLPRRERSDFFF